jgi:DNA-binding transcriptional LysR family regulator
MTIGFEELLALDAIMVEGSFRAASDKLHKSQSSVSYAIKILEKELGVEIFDRSTYKPLLTAEGTIIYQKALEIIAMKQNLEGLSALFRSGIENQISLTISIVLPDKILSHALMQLKSEFPNTKIELDFGSFDYPVQSVKNGQVDIAIAADSRNEIDVEKKFFTSIDLIPVITRQYNQSKPSLKEQVEIVVGERSLTSRKLSNTMFEEHETWHVTDYSLKKHLILSNLGWGFMPAHLIETELNNGSLLICPQRHAEKINLCTYRRKLDCYGPVNAKLWQILDKG